MTEEAATADATEPATGEEGTEGKPEGKPEEEQLRAEGVKALNEWKSRAKAAEKQAKEFEDRLGKIEESNKSESEKALDKARKEARKEAESEFEKERRSDRIEVAVAGYARELADVDLTVLALKQQGIDDLFDEDGKVKADDLKDALFAKDTGLLSRKPHLRAQNPNVPTGDGDGGKGEGGEGGSFNDTLRAQARR